MLTRFNSKTSSTEEDEANQALEDSEEMEEDDNTIKAKFLESQQEQKDSKGEILRVLITHL